MRLSLLGQGPDTRRPYKITNPFLHHFIRPTLQALGCQRTDSKSKEQPAAEQDTSKEQPEERTVGERGPLE